MLSRVTWKKEKTMATSVVEVQKKDGAGQSPKIEIVRVIRASRQRVFDAWTRPEMIRLWFEPGVHKVEDARMDAQVGGEYRIAMTGACAENGQPDVSRNSMVTGRYTRVDPYDVLAFTWKNSWNPGEESLVTIELRDVEGGTEMKFTHDRFLTEESRDRHLVGWSSIVTKLQEFFENA